MSYLSINGREMAMAVGVILEFDGASLDQYDEVIAKMGFSPGGATAPGALFHWVTETDRGFRVTDVWETREQFERFSAEQIGPLTQQIGVTTPPTVSIFEVHNYLTRA
jgi:hypothetical protein